MLFKDRSAGWVENQHIQSHFSQVADWFVWEISSNRNFKAAVFCRGFYMSQSWNVPTIDFMQIWKSFT